MENVVKEVTIAELEENFDAIFEEVGDGESFVITNEDGQPLAVMIPYEEYESMNQSAQSAW